MRRVALPAPPSRGGVPATIYRRLYDAQGHAAPRSGTNREGGVWRGHSKIHDRAARRRANRRSWKRLREQARRDALTGRRDAMQSALTAAIDALEDRRGA